MHEDNDDTILDTDESVEYWVGWLASTLGSTLRLLEAVDADGDPVHDRSEIIPHARFAFDRFASSSVGRGDAILDIVNLGYAGFVVEDTIGRAQALRETYAGALAARDQAEAYWDEAATCGHPDAPTHVANLYPFRVRQVTRQEWDAILGEGTPVLDREG